MKETEITQLQRNVKDLQKQLQEAYIRIGELNTKSSEFYEENSKLKKLVRDFPNDQELGRELRLMITGEHEEDDWRKGTLWEKK